MLHVGSPVTFNKDGYIQGCDLADSRSAGVIGVVVEISEKGCIVSMANGGGQFLFENSKIEKKVKKVEKEPIKRTRYEALEIE